MSIEAVMSRMNQIQSMLATGAAPAPTQQQKPSGTSFSSQLATAQGGTFASAATGTTAAPTTAATTATAATGTSELPTGTPYAAEITAAAKANGLDPALLAGLVKQESGFKADAGSPAGARGLTQLMPATAAGLGVTNVLDPVQNLNGGAKYLKQQLDAFGGDTAQGAGRLQRRPRRRQALRRHPAVRRDPELRPHRPAERCVVPDALPVASAAPPYSSSNAPSEI